MSMIKFETIESKLIRHGEQRNIDKFPNNYAFQLSENDLDIMVSQNVTPSNEDGEIIDTTTKFEFNIGLTIVCLGLGTIVFKRPRPHFGDVL